MDFQKDVGDCGHTPEYNRGPEVSVPSDQRIVTAGRGGHNWLYNTGWLYNSPGQDLTSVRPPALQTAHTWARAGLTWGPGTAKIHAPLCRDRYWQTSPNLIVQLMMPQSLKMVLFSPGLKASSYHLESCTSWSLLNCLR